MQQIIAAVALLALLLSACGGGGGGDSPPPRSATFSGTVAIGAPLAGQRVQVLHVDGASAFATTDAAGRYSVTLSGFALDARPLFIIQTGDSAPAIAAPSQYPRLYSIANTRSGTVNLTPLTSLLVAQLIGERQGFFADLALFRSLPTPSDADIAAARAQVVNYLTQRPDPNDPIDPQNTISVNASAVADFIRTPFNAVTGDPHDNAIESLAQTFMAGETIEGVEEHMLARSDSAATLLEILSLEFDANCVAEGNPDPTLPVGPVHVSLRPTGEITIGIYSHTFATGDRVRRSNPPFFDGFWQFTLLNADQIHLFDSGTRLTSIAVLRSGSGTRCAPTTEVPLGAGKPSLLAQVRKLDADLVSPNPGFNCPAGPSTFPGVSGGANTLAIQENGALRVAAGHALHLPSLGLDINAEITNNAGVLSTRVVTAGFSRSFADGFDSFGLNLDTNGAITRAQFSQRRGTVTESANCPI